MNDFLVQNKKPALFLAPMEGVTDAPLREMLTELVPFTHSVTEFIRITDRIPTDKTFFDYCPELKNQSRTKSGTPVIVQLLGGQPEPLVQSALRAVELGAQAIDMNFGCPAKTVNRHDGGASLLKFPERTFTIIQNLKTHLPKNISVSAKIRLGFDNPNDVYKITDSLLKADVDWITIHARTRNQGYRPPAFWEFIRDIKKVSPKPIIANGDIFSIDDFRRCRDITQCEHFMIGRGIFSNPFLAEKIAFELGYYKNDDLQETSSEFWRDWFVQMFEVSEKYQVPQRNVLFRVKQWLNLKRLISPADCFNQIKLIQNHEEFLNFSRNVNNFNMTDGSN